MKRKLINTFILFVCFNVTAQGQVVPKLDRTQIMIGDRLTYSFAMPVKEADRIALYAPLAVKDSIEITGNRIDTVQNSIQVSFYLTSFVAGNHIIRNEAENSIPFSVVPMDVDTVKMIIKDIAPNAKEPLTFKELMPFILWSLAGVGFVGLVILGIFLWRKFRGRVLKEILSSPKPKLPAHIIALTALEELRKKHLIEKARVKEYYSELTDIFRVYLEDRFSVMAMEMTTEEIFATIENISEADHNTFMLIREVLKTADLVKFAKYIPQNSLADKFLEDIRLFVESTKRKETEND